MEKEDDRIMIKVSREITTLAIKFWHFWCDQIFEGTHNDRVWKNLKCLLAHVEDFKRTQEPNFPGGSDHLDGAPDETL